MKHLYRQAPIRAVYTQQEIDRQEELRNAKLQYALSLIALGMTIALAVFLFAVM